MELLWQNGQVVVHTQNHQRSVKKSHVDKDGGGDAAIPVPEGASAVEEMATSHQHLFMQEDEMASWLHYPLVESPIERYFSADLLYPTSSSPDAAAAPPRDIRPFPPEIRRPSTATSLPPIPPPRRADADGSPRLQSFSNFPRFSRPGIKPPGPSPAASTVVESNDTPIVPREYRDSLVADSTAQVSGGNLGRGGAMSETEAAGTSTVAPATCELTVTSSPDDRSGGSVSAEKSTAPETMTADDRKGKGSETDDEGHIAVSS